jgi:hypothetical protein
MRAWWREGNEVVGLQSREQQQDKEAHDEDGVVATNAKRRRHQTVGAQLFTTG